jgi:hypothetical protein
VFFTGFQETIQGEAMTISTIRDTVKALAQSLQAAAVFPAGLFVFVNVYLILPKIIQNLDTASSSVIIVAIALTLMLSYTLYAFNFPLIRLFEGYRPRQADFFQFLERRQRQRFDHLNEQIRKLTAEYGRLENWLGIDLQEENREVLNRGYRLYWEHLKVQLAKLKFDLDRFFASTSAAVLPTKLGNVIAAFEDYPRTRYGMDSIALWPRLVPILKNTNYMEFVAQEKSVFDFLLNAWVIVAALGTELTYFYLFKGRILLAAIVFGAAFLSCVTIYQGMTVAARQWGTTVRVAFDLYRHDLHQRLGVCSANSFPEEYRRWQQVSSFFLHRADEIWFTDFIPQIEIEQRKKEKQKENS